jgi:hypothetical protein
MAKQVELLYAEMPSNGVDVRKVFVDGVGSAGRGGATRSPLFEGNDLIFAGQLLRDRREVHWHPWPAMQQNYRFCIWFRINNRE